MTSKLQKRGRPKGTGLDDRAHLRAIADLIHQSKDLKPTTAIRSLGISDPSTIRRLRDKYNSARIELDVAIKAAAKLAKDKENNILQADFTKAETTNTPDSDDPTTSSSNVIPLNPLTRDTSAQSCALNAPGEPKLVERKKRKPAKKKPATANKAKSKPNRTATKKLKTETKTTQSRSKKPTRKATTEKPASTPPSQEQPNPLNAWLAMSAQVMAATARTQLQMLELAQSSQLYQEVRDAQSHAIDAWLSTLATTVSFNTKTQSNSPIPEAVPSRAGK